jgi:ADP-heptose:LPS heptosyltransferase
MIKKILVIRNDRFGEFLLNIPAIRALKRAYPMAKLILAVKDDVLELAKLVNAVDEVAVWEDIKNRLKSYDFDLAVILNPSKEAHWAVFRAGIALRAGYNRKWGFLLTHKIEDKKSLALKHEVEYNLDLVSLVGAKIDNRSIALSNLSEANNSLYEGAIAIHPFTSDPLKQWPIERFMELAQKIAQEPSLKVILVGKSLGDAPKGTVPIDLAINLINKTSLVELAQVLQKCKLLITCDSGPMHLAAAIGTPVIALFRNDLPGKTAKRWGPWGEGHIIIEKDKLEDISVDEVLNAVRRKI